MSPKEDAKVEPKKTGFNQFLVGKSSSFYTLRKSSLIGRPGQPCNFVSLVGRVGHAPGASLAPDPGALQGGRFPQQPAQDLQPLGQLLFGGSGTVQTHCRQTCLVGGEKCRASTKGHVFGQRSSIKLFDICCSHEFGPKQKSTLRLRNLCVRWERFANYLGGVLATFPIQFFKVLQMSIECAKLEILSKGHLANGRRVHVLLGLQQGKVLRASSRD